MISKLRELVRSIRIWILAWIQLPQTMKLLREDLDTYYIRLVNMAIDVATSSERQLRSYVKGKVMATTSEAEKRVPTSDLIVAVAGKLRREIRKKTRKKTGRKSK